MHNGTSKVLKTLEANPDVDVIEYGCLGNCGECYSNPYALVNGEIISGDTAEELQEHIDAKLKEIEAMLDLLGE
jgi:uncharacterized protein YuzB (UPF0349 family)